MNPNELPIHRGLLRHVYTLVAVLVTAGILLVVSTYATDRASRGAHTRIENLHLRALTLIAEIDYSMLELQRMIMTPGSAERLDAPGFVYAIRRDLDHLSELYETHGNASLISALARTRNRFEQLAVQPLLPQGIEHAGEKLSRLEVQLEQLRRLHSTAAEEELSTLAENELLRRTGLWVLMAVVGLASALLVRRIIRIMSATIQRQTDMETALRASEEQVQQMQKIEALGQLVGGVAHDFNNLLTAILGNVDILQSTFGTTQAQSAELEEIEKAAMRAASLTSQLLAFSRQQPTRPEVVDLGALLGNMQPMLRRLIGEHFALSIDCDDNPLPVYADPGQLEQVILNLVLNARDALPEGGHVDIVTERIVIEAGTSKFATVTADTYCRLRVRDDGAGIAEDILPRIFEPFFTTKQPGRGSGLGLSVVHGIVRMSGGHISIESNPGVGTSVDILWPKCSLALPQKTEDDPQGRPRRGSETILIAEDEDQVRRLVTLGLRELGYEVLAAAGGSEALALCSQHDGGIDLVISDVIMPGMNGLEFVDAALQYAPGARVILISGYTDEVLTTAGAAAADYRLIDKPFTVGDLAAIIRETLDTPGHARSGERAGATPH